ncbi:MAG TPA: hypothetical protein VLM79_29410 [Kofleriaceae bacterium]|nr:hypothetical protein [Kofleriaceae bacterium]
MSTTDPQKLADRYAAVWNEPDPTARRRAIAALWAPDGVHYVQDREYRGHQALEERVLDAYDKNVRLTGNRFRAVRNAQALRNVVEFNWEMLAPSGEQVLAVGLEVVILDDEHHIVRDYQFIVS